MNIALVKLYKNGKTQSNEKKLEYEETQSFYELIKNFINKLIYNFKFMTNKVWHENKDTYFVMNFNEKSKSKLKALLTKNNVQKVIVEDDVDIDFETLDGSEAIKFTYIQVIDELRKQTNKDLPEISVCVNEYNENTKGIIKEFSRITKVVNVVTQNEAFFNLEKELENNNIFITVSTNKRKALKKAELMLNIDFNSVKDYNVNRKMMIINLNNKIQVAKSFEGIIIKSVQLTTKKVMKIFAENENLPKSKLLEKELIEMNSKERADEFIRTNKITIKSLNNKDMSYEFKRIIEN